MLSRIDEIYAGRLKQNALTTEDKQFIEHAYLEVVGKKFVGTSCHDCYRDAVIEIKIRFKKQMGQQKYQLKNGVILHQHGTGRVFSNVNLTDKDAEAHLAEHPSDICFFDHFPTDWKREVAPKAKEAKAKREVAPKAKEAKAKREVAPKAKEEGGQKEPQDGEPKEVIPDSEQ